MNISISEAAKILGVCPKTLRRWERKGLLIPERTQGNHRRYNLKSLLEFKETGIYSPRRGINSGLAAIYCKVLSDKWEKDLEFQYEKLKKAAIHDGFEPIAYKEIDTGLDDPTSALAEFIGDAFAGKFDIVYFMYEDHDSYSEIQLIREILDMAGIPLVVINGSEKDH